MSDRESILLSDLARTVGIPIAVVDGPEVHLYLLFRERQTLEPMEWPWPDRDFAGTAFLKSEGFQIITP